MYRKSETETSGRASNLEATRCLCADQLVAGRVVGLMKALSRLCIDMLLSLPMCPRRRRLRKPSPDGAHDAIRQKTITGQIFLPNSYVKSGNALPDRKNRRPALFNPIIPSFQAIPCLLRNCSGNCFQNYTKMTQQTSLN